MWFGSQMQYFRPLNSYKINSVARASRGQLETCWRNGGAKHPLSPGVFIICCGHGVVLAIIIMRTHESEQIPMSTFYQRCPKGDDRQRLMMLMMFFIAPSLPHLLLVWFVV